jgi:hypothetical protein
LLRNPVAARIEKRVTSTKYSKSSNTMNSQMNSLFFQLFIRTFSGKTVSIQVQPSDTVAAVKDKVQNKQGEVVGDQYLAYVGKQLDDRRSLGDYGVGQGCTLELSPRLRGGCPKPRCQYGTACYRKCPTHKANFDHSYPPQHGSVVKKPKCKYGSACYRACPSHKAKYDHSSPIQTVGKEWRMFHGTSFSAAQQIKQGGKHGLHPSTSGMLGAGVYCSRDITKARIYAHGAGGGVIFELRVRTGKVKAIRHLGHPLQQTWHQAGYDTAWVPKGVNPKGHEENCVWDHTRVTIVGVAESDCGFTW